MKEPKLIWHSLGHAVLVLIYVSIVAFVMNHGQQWFGKEDTAWTPVAVLMLFVLSAAITGSLVLGRPVMMFLEGQKREALRFFGLTISWLFVLTILVFLVLMLMKP